MDGFLFVYAYGRVSFHIILYVWIFRLSNYVPGQVSPANPHLPSTGEKKHYSISLRPEQLLTSGIARSSCPRPHPPRPVREAGELPRGGGEEGGHRTASDPTGFGQVLGRLRTKTAGLRFYTSALLEGLDTETMEVRIPWPAVMSLLLTEDEQVS